MAVKVIKYGKIRRVTCPSCESLLEFEVEDAHYKQTGMNEGEYVIQCPNCNEDVKIPYDILARRN